MAVALRLLGLAAWLGIVVVAGCGAVFAVLTLAPGSASDVAGAAIAELDFLDWLTAAITGDLGISQTYRVGAPVSGLIWAALAESISIVALGLLLTMATALGLAWLWVGHVAPRVGRASRWLTYALSASPAFLLAYWIINVSNVSVVHASAAGWIARPQWFPMPSGGAVRYVLAAVALAVGSGVLMEAARGLSAEVERIMASEFVLFARAGGEPLWRHVGPSLVAPLTSSVVNRLTALFGGSVVIETVFNIPGLGRLTWEAALRRDAAVLLGVTAVWAVAYATAKLCSEAIVVVVDPRRRVAGGLA